MSHKLYDQMLSEAVSEFTDLYQAEFKPYDQLTADGKKLTGVKKPAEWLQIYAQLYISYIQTFKKFEEVYDQIIHPQKRVIVKQMLDNTMMRIVELRKDLVMFNVSTKAVNSDFVNFDELLFELKILPEQLEVPIPRYLKVENPRLAKRAAIVEGFLEMEDRHLPEEEVMEIRNPVEMDPEAEIWMILVNERGRQGIQRGAAQREAFKNKKKNKAKENENKDLISMLVLQKYIRAFIDREKVEKLRNEEMEFLGMLPTAPQMDDVPFWLQKQGCFDHKQLGILDRPVPEDPLLFVKPGDNPSKLMSNVADIVKGKRRGEQNHAEKSLKKMVESVKNEIKEHEVPDMKENLMYDMRTWITQYYEQHEGKELPPKVEDFYTRNDKSKPMTKEEEDAAKKAKAEKEKAEKKAAEDKKKGKKTEAEQFMDDRQARGPDNSRPLKALNEQVQKYIDTWMTREDGDNFDQRPNKELIINKVMPEIEESVIFILQSTKLK